MIFLLTEKKTAKMLDMSPQTLRNDRFAGKGLPYVKIGRAVRYKRSDVERMIEQCTVHPREK